MSSIKQLIINAIIKVSGENPALNREGEASAAEARDDFIRCLMLELFPEESAVVSVSVAEPAAKSPKKAKKAKVTKTAEEPAAPASPAKSPKEVKAEAKAAAAAAKAAEKEAAKAAKEAAKSPKKAKKATKEEVEAPAPSPKKSPKAAKAPKAPKVAKPAEDSNLPKMDPTWRKHLKKADKAATKESESELLAYLNALTKEEFNAKKAEDHVADFLAGRAAPAVAQPKEENDGKELADITEIEFEGKTYSVNLKSKRVYEGEGEYNEEVGWTNYKGVGYVGMAAFEKMEV